MISKKVPIVIYDDQHRRRVVGCTFLQLPLLNYFDSHGEPLKVEVALVLSEGQREYSEAYVSKCEITDPEMIRKVFGDSAPVSSKDQPPLDI